ncbi:MAG: glycosyltransferase family 2 protein [Pacificimonas sp.]
MTRISVVIPTHLRAELLRDAVDSVVRQTRLPDELIVVGDVEDDATRQAIADFKTGLDFPIVYRRNLAVPGVCGSRNLGARVASGDRLAFLDDDDVWQPAFLESCADAATATGASLVIAPLHEVSPTGRRRVRRQPEGLLPATLFSQPGGMTGSNFLVERRAFFSAGGFDPRVAVFNDWDLFFRLVALPARYTVLPEPLVEWRQHEGARIGTFSERRAAGLDFFVSRYRDHMPMSLVRELSATAAGMRRCLSRSKFDYAKHSLALARAHGLGGAMKKILKVET